MRTALYIAGGVAAVYLAWKYLLGGSSCCAGCASTDTSCGSAAAANLSSMTPGAASSTSYAGSINLGGLLGPVTAAPPAPGPDPSAPASGTEIIGSSFHPIAVDVFRAELAPKTVQPAPNNRFSSSPGGIVVGPTAPASFT